MPPRKTIDEVKKRIYELSDGTVELLTKEYINNKQKLELCCKCGEPFERDYEHINRGQIFCKKCSQEIVADKLKYSLDDVKQLIAEHGCEYIDGEYENNNSKLTIRCRCGEVFEKSLLKFLSGQDRCRECGKENFIQSKRKYNPEQAKVEFAKYGYTMIGEYVDLSTPVKCLCKRGHECYIKLGLLPAKESSCPDCHSIDYGGIDSSLDKALRGRLSAWKNEVKKFYDYRCPITGDTDDLDVHHLTSFSVILESILRNYNINKQEEIDTCLLDDDCSEYYSFLQELLAYHNVDMGILISRSVHTQFHQQYGYKDNTPEQFNEFLIENYSITLEEIQKGKVCY